MSPQRSATVPNRNGTIAPPMIAVHMMPDPCGVRSPSPSVARQKIVGNISELQKPTRISAQPDSAPVVTADRMISEIAPAAKVVSTRPGLASRRMKPPSKRPTNAPSQYNPTNLPAPWSPHPTPPRSAQHAIQVQTKQAQRRDRERG